VFLEPVRSRDPGLGEVRQDESRQSKAC